MNYSENWTNSSSSRDKARADAAVLRKKKIKSPNVADAKYHVRIGRGDYFTNSPAKYEKLLAKKEAYELDLKKFIAKQIQ